ncbi:putative 2-oxoglutarate-dependent dioxygenase AOP1.2 [Vitis vinifera]|uniref:Putative 2-oxoglutarate-dependent dioxygenase AOP1.2 n=1 Tax=Vitis vinifera TaxID=29760 RepID=A0A438D0P2_VITVI|nr:putative 2-oxoglutarate-dependent dioxygenase AOP1.2 [Vitis vinifera]
MSRIVGLETLPKIPMVDFSKENLKPGTDSWLPACNNVRHALEEYGCFMAVYDQVPLGVHNTIFGAMRELFDLPIETKKQNISEKPYQGYTSESPAAPLHQGLGIDNVTTNLEEIRHYSFISDIFSSFLISQSVHCYSKLVAELDRMVVRMVLESYGIENGSHIESASFLVRLLKSRVPKMNETNKAFPSHSDKSFISILHQNKVNGLEIQTKDGKWISHEPPSLQVFLVMAGEVLTIRLGLFSTINGMIKVPEELVDDHHPLQFKPFDHTGLLHFLGTKEGRNPETALKAYCAISGLSTTSAALTMGMFHSLLFLRRAEF